MPVLEEEYDIVVVGAGHAGCEAALAGARLGLKTIILPPMLSRIPPTEMVGSVSASIRMYDSMDVVVVFPWVPLTAMEYL